MKFEAHIDVTQVNPPSAIGEVKEILGHEFNANKRFEPSLESGFTRIPNSLIMSLSARELQVYSAVTMSMHGECSVSAFRLQDLARRCGKTPNAVRSTLASLVRKKVLASVKETRSTDKIYFQMAIPKALKRDQTDIRTYIEFKVVAPTKKEKILDINPDLQKTVGCTYRKLEVEPTENCRSATTLYKTEKERVINSARLRRTSLSIDLQSKEMKEKHKSDKRDTQYIRRDIQEPRGDIQPKTALQYFLDFYRDMTYTDFVVREDHSPEEKEINTHDTEVVKEEESTLPLLNKTSNFSQMDGATDSSSDSSSDSVSGLTLVEGALFKSIPLQISGISLSRKKDKKTFVKTVNLLAKKDYAGMNLHSLEFMMYVITEYLSTEKVAVEAVGISRGNMAYIGKMKNVLNMLDENPDEARVKFRAYVIFCVAFWDELVLKWADKGIDLLDNPSPKSMLNLFSQFFPDFQMGHVDAGRSQRGYRGDKRQALKLDTQKLAKSFYADDGKNHYAK